jgi:hypothetical protein
MALPFARIVLDGEAVAHCPEGLPDFHTLLSRRYSVPFTPSTSCTSVGMISAGLSLSGGLSPRP